MYNDWFCVAQLTAAALDTLNMSRTTRGESFPNLIESNRNQIVFTIFRLIWHQTDVRLVPNQPENGKYNMISV